MLPIKKIPTALPRNRQCTHALCVLALVLALGTAEACGGDASPRVRGTLRPTSSPIASEDIAFESQRSSRVEIHASNRFGSDLVNLSAKAGSTNSHPSWSPDGKRLAFTSEREGPGDIYTMN
ncbi:MAG: hypothetical protein E6I09_03050, partial [Chloroflexi bacterium]